ncbi:NADH-quinone oxidoreductase subunit J, partial [Pararhodobacter marinus]
MGFAQFAFTVFAVATVIWGLGVIFARNPVHSVLCLIMAFISTAGLFVLIGAEYLAFLLVVVYVG